MRESDDDMRDLGENEDRGHATAGQCCRLLIQFAGERESGDERVRHLLLKRIEEQIFQRHSNQVEAAMRHSELKGFRNRLNVAGPFQRPLHSLPDSR